MTKINDIIEIRDENSNAYILEGFTNIPNFIIASEELSTPAKMLYITLSMFRFGKQDVFPKQDTLCKMLGYKSRESIRQYTKELEEWGLISYKIVNEGFIRKTIYTFKKYYESKLYKQTEEKLTPKNVENSECPDKLASNAQTNGHRTPRQMGINNNNINNKKINNIIINNNDSAKAELLFDTSKQKLKGLILELKKLNKNKNPRRCAELRIEIAQITNNWNDVTFRDFAYYFAYVLYKKHYGKVMIIDKYFTSDIKTFIANYDIPKHLVIDVFNQMLENYEYRKTKEFPEITQLLFKQKWLLDDFIPNVLEDVERKLNNKNIDNTPKTSSEKDYPEFF